MSPSFDLSGRYDRQRDAYPPERLKLIHAVVVGCGAIGHPLVLGLAKMGVGKITLIDPDIVEVVNLAVQGYREGDLGLPKVLVCAAQIEELNSEVDVRPIQELFGSDREVYYDLMETINITDEQLVVFSAVDNMEGRKLLHTLFKEDCVLFVDGRIAGSVVQTLACCPGHPTWDYYASQLHESSESVQLPCSIRTQLFPSEMTAAMMVAQLGNWIRLEEEGIAHNVLFDTGTLQDISSIQDPLPVQLEAIIEES